MTEPVFAADPLRLLIAAAAGNDKLKNMLSELWNGLSRGVLVNEEEYVRKSLKEHEEIVESIRKGDAMECYLRMQKHIKSSCENFVQRYN